MASDEEAHLILLPEPEQTPPQDSTQRKRRRKKKNKTTLNAEEAQPNQLDAENQHELVAKPEPKPQKDPEHSKPQLFSNSESNPEQHELPDEPVPVPLEGLNHCPELVPKVEPKPPQEEPGFPRPQLLPKSDLKTKHNEPMPSPLISSGQKKRKRKKSVGNLVEAAAESRGLSTVQPEMKPTPFEDPEYPQLSPKSESNSNHHELSNKAGPAPPTDQDPDHSKPQLFSNSESNAEQLELLDKAVPVPLESLNHCPDVVPKLDPKPPQDPGFSQPQLLPKSELKTEHHEPMPSPLISSAQKRKKRKKTSVGNLVEAATESKGLGTIQPEMKPTPFKDPECPQLSPKSESNSKHHELSNKAETAPPTDQDPDQSKPQLFSNSESNPEQLELLDKTVSVPLESLNHCPDVVPKLDPKPPQDPGFQQPQLLPKSELKTEHNEPVPSPLISSGQKKRKRKKKSVGNLEEAAAESKGLSTVQPELEPTPFEDPECPQLSPKSESNSKYHELSNKTEPAPAADQGPEHSKPQLFSNSESNLEQLELLDKAVPVPLESLNHCPDVVLKLDPKPPQDPGFSQPQLLPKSELKTEHNEPMPSPLISSAQKRRKRKKKSVGNLEEAAAESKGLSTVQPELEPTPFKDPECPQLSPKSESNSKHRELSYKAEPAPPMDQCPEHSKPQLFSNSESNPEQLELPDKVVPVPLESLNHCPDVVPKLDPKPPQEPGFPQPQLLPKSELKTEHNEPVPSPLISSGQKKRKRKKKSLGNLEEAAAESKVLSPELKPTPFKDPKCPQLSPKPESNSKNHELSNKAEPAPPTDSGQKQRKRKKKRTQGCYEEGESNSKHHELPNKPEPAPPTNSGEKKRKRKKKKTSNGVNATEIPVQALGLQNANDVQKLIGVVTKRKKSRKPTTRPGERQKRCTSCQQFGHQAKECQQPKQQIYDEEICFFCAGIGHSLGKCPRSIKGVSQYAKCLACKEYGHVSRNCPKNVNGINPQGSLPVAASGQTDTPGTEERPGTGVANT